MQEKDPKNPAILVFRYNYCSTVNNPLITGILYNYHHPWSLGEEHTSPSQ